jgi:hypothetical protein
MNDHNFNRFMSKCARNNLTGCLEWTGRLNAHGYGLFVIGHSKTFLAHRVNYEHVHGEIPEGARILHSCDNPRCVNIEHLRAGTQAENVSDMVERDRLVPPPPKPGELNPQAKLSAAQVEEVRRRYIPRKVTLKMLSKEYNVCEATISMIVNGKRWRVA